MGWCPQDGVSALIKELPKSVVPFFPPYEDTMRRGLSLKPDHAAP